MLGCRELDRDLRLCNAFLELDERVAHALDVRDGRPHVVGLPVEGREVVAEDADDDRIARPREHLVDPLVEVGLHVVERPGVPVDDLLDLRDGLLVVGVRIDRDPVLTEVHACDLVRQEGLPDVGAHVLRRPGPS